MHWIDWVILLVMGYGLITGWSSGLVRTLLNVAALVAAFVMGPMVRPLAMQVVDLVMTADPLVKTWFATAIAYGSIYVGLSVLGILWSRFLAKGVIKTSDKIAGLLLGGALSLVVLAVPLALILAVPALATAPVVQRTMAQSRLLPLLRPIAPMLQGLAYGFLHPAKSPGAQAAPQHPAPAKSRPATTAKPRPTTGHR